MTTAGTSSPEQVPLQIGDPIRITKGGSTIYGRVASFAGDSYRGVYPRVVLRTPHGSMMEAGIIWVSRLTEEEMPTLLAYDDLAAKAHDLRNLDLGVP